MSMHNSNNERIKRRYFSYLKEAKRHDEQTIDAVAKALDRFEAHTKHRDFRAFRFEQAVSFKRYLAERRAQRSGEKLSKATLHATLSHLKRFFQWLADQPGYKSTVGYSDADYFNLSDKDARVARARRGRPTPTLEQVRHVIATMPANTDIELRNRALVAFTLLTGARDRAIASMKLKHIDLEGGNVFQDARDVQTKFSKTFTAFFFPVGSDIRQIVADWVQYLRQVKLRGNESPLFPATLVAVGPTRSFVVSGLDDKHWSSASPIRSIFRAAFEAAGLPYFNPHSFRNTLVLLGEKMCRTPEDFKAWSQNLGHDGVLTTFFSYGEVALPRQGDIIRSLGRPQANTPTNAQALLRELARALEQNSESPPAPARVVPV